MIEKKNNFKTGAYTFIRPMLTGAILADADQKNKDLVIELGKYLGLAFQLKDDMMDITFGDDTKSPFSDMQEGQQTYFTHYIMTQGTETQKACLQSCMGKKLSPQKIQELQTVFQESGAILSGKKLIELYAQQAKDVLQKIVFTNDIASQGISLLIQKIANV